MLRKLPVSEQELKTQAKNFLLISGHFVWVNNSGVTKSQYTNKLGIESTRMWRSGIPGISDIIGICTCGKFIAVEVKVGSNKVSIAQNGFLEEIRSRGGHTLAIWDYETLELKFGKGGEFYHGRR